MELFTCKGISIDFFVCVLYFSQPVLVSGMHKKMNFSLWKADSISLDFGNQQADILNCKDSIISNTNVKEFWDGFEDVSSTLLQMYYSIDSECGQC